MYLKVRTLFETLKVKLYYYPLIVIITINVYSLHIIYYT